MVGALGPIDDRKMGDVSTKFIFIAWYPPCYYSLIGDTYINSFLRRKHDGGVFDGDDIYFSRVKLTACVEQIFFKIPLATDGALAFCEFIT